jgi:hypothetical protein
MTADADDAYRLFLRARSAVTAVQYPQRIDYVIRVSGTEGGRPRANHYKGSFDLTDDAIRIFPISDEEMAAPPPDPHDFDFKQIVVQGMSVPIGRPNDPDLLGGSPILDPTYSFGLRFKRIVASATTTADAESDLPIIAVVSNSARDYDVSLLAKTQLNGEETYHFGLKPLRKPKRFRLRELWVGANDFLPRKAVIAGNFTVAPLVDVPWVVSFNVIGGIPYISSERAEDVLYLSHRHVVDDAEVAFEGVREASGDFIGAPLVAPDITPTNLVEP